MAENKMLNLADRLKELKDKKSKLDFELRELNGQIDVIQKDLIQVMTDEECQSFKRNGVNFCLVIKEYPSAVLERKAELYDTMKQKGFEHLFTINSNTLSATIKELKSNNEDELPEWLNGMIKIAEKTSIQVRRK